MVEDRDFDSPESIRFLRLFRNADFDPTGGILTGALALAGGAMSAAGTLAGGSAAATMGRMQQQAALFQATQDTMNGAAEIAAASARSQEMRMQANLTRSRAVAQAGAGGVVTTGGSTVTNEAEISARGGYASALELWNGQNAATGELNKAAAAEYSGQMDLMGGQMAQEASEFSAAGTLVSSGASAFKAYGMGSGGNLSPTPSAGASVGFG